MDIVQKKVKTEEQPHTMSLKETEDIFQKTDIKDLIDKGDLKKIEKYFLAIKEMISKSSILTHEMLL